ncbi:MAG: YiiX/YebB-like N1pC/P60 family cysteine hydrolase [Chloroflexi bacterium]|nr:YiiX/YebB-like N1pC/P60 family cysteine hydrolase [Chloroflexota bacterium]
MSASIHAETSFDLSRGDLLFQDLAGDGATAIESVTAGYSDAEVSHIGMVVEARPIKAIEAINPEVRLTALSEFLNRARDELERPRVFVGRLKSDFRHLIPRAIDAARSLIGRPYDRLYMPSEEAYYCSELVVDAFKCANDGNEFFPEHPMSFRNENTGQILPYWERYFSKLNADVPDGQSGSNPGSISLSDRIDIVHRYGSITNWPL